MNARCDLESLVVRVRSSFRTACAALALGCLLAFPAAARAQTFFELGGGWNYVAPAHAGDPAADKYSRGFNVRASLGRQLAPGFRLRLDAFTSQFDDKYYPPMFCTDLYPCGPLLVESVGIAALTANGLLNVDPRGILYVIGGAGVYDVYGHTTSQRSRENGLSVGVSAGAGISVPVGARLRAFAEARYHVLLGTTAQPPWLVPITVGVRFR
jgi:hypothetical protein